MDRSTDVQGRDTEEEHLSKRLDVEGTDTEEEHMSKRLEVEDRDTEKEHMSKRLEVKGRKKEDMDMKGMGTEEGMHGYGAVMIEQHPNDDGAETNRETPREHWPIACRH